MPEKKKREPTITSERIRALREAHHLGMGYAANQLEPPAGESTWKNWENGTNRPSFERLVSIADFFNVTVDYLLGRADQPRATSHVGGSPPELADPSSLAAEASARGGKRRANRPRPAKARGSRKPRPAP